MPPDPRRYNKGAEASPVNDDPYAEFQYDSGGGSGGGGSGNNNFRTLAYLKPWPYVPPDVQASIEHRYLEDGVTIHFDRLRGLQFWAPLFFVTGRYHTMFIIRKLMNVGEAAQRPLTATEVDALSEHADAATRKFAWSGPVALVGLAFAVTRGARTFRFPLYQPKMKLFNPFYFPLASTPILTGQGAARAWHVARAAAYFPFTLLASVLFFGSISESSFQAHYLRDSRLKPLIQEIHDVHVRSHSQRLGHGVGRALPPAWDEHIGQSPPRPVQSGTPQQAYRAAVSGKPSGATGSWGASPPRQSQGSGTPQDGDWSSDPFEDDDTSPVAPSVRRAEAMQQRHASNGGSSWARLRQKTQPGSADFARGDSSGQERGWAQLRQDGAQNTKEGPRGTTESYTYSREDEEREGRNYEKEQAQKEFDALLESERRGEAPGRRR